jgi:general secretion pathway protein G
MKLSPRFPQNRLTRRTAFTLLEVLVVVAIIVILAGVGTFAYMRYLTDAKKTQAQLKAKTIATAIEAYYANPNSNQQYPTQLGELIQPPWGGTSFLKNGQEDLIDPWGSQYQIQFITGADGSQQVVVFTNVKDDGTVISQHGVGPQSKLQ